MTLEIIPSVLVLTFILHWVLFRLYFTTCVKDQYWSRLITHQWAVKRLLKRASEALGNMDHALLGQNAPGPDFISIQVSLLPFQLCWGASQSSPSFQVSRIAEGWQYWEHPHPILRHQKKDQISIHSTSRFFAGSHGISSFYCLFFHISFPFPFFNFNLSLQEHQLFLLNWSILCVDAFMHVWMCAYATALALRQSVFCSPYGSQQSNSGPRGWWQTL